VQPRFSHRGQNGTTSFGVIGGCGRDNLNLLRHTDFEVEISLWPFPQRTAKPLVASRDNSVQKCLDSFVPVVHDFLETWEFTEGIEVRVNSRPPQFLMPSFNGSLKPLKC